MALSFCSKHATFAERRYPPVSDSESYRYACADETFLRFCLDCGGANPAVPSKQVGQVESDNQLLNAAAAIGSIPVFELVKSITSGGGHPLHSAAEALASATVDRPSRMSMVKFLVDEQGYDLNAMDTPSGRRGTRGTPVQYAMRFPSGAEEVVRFLVARGADPCIKNHSGISAIDMARKNGDCQMLNILCGWGNITNARHKPSILEGNSVL